MRSQFDRDRIERVARIYSSNKDAAAALGILPQSFQRLCKKYGVQTPIQRRKARANAQKGA